MSRTDGKSINLENPEELFDWLTKIVTDEIYTEDVLTNALVKLKIWELAKRQNLHVKFEWRYLEKEKRMIDFACLSEKKPLLALEIQNSTRWHDIKNDLDKLDECESEIKFGVFHVGLTEDKSSKAKENADKKARKLFEKIKEFIDKRKSRKKWLLAIGTAVESRSWYYGFVLENGQWRGLGKKSLKRE